MSKLQFQRRRQARFGRVMQSAMLAGMIIAAFVLARPAEAVVIAVDTSLDFFQEVMPSNPVPSDATGMASLRVDTETGLYDLTLSVLGITQPELFDVAGSPVHIHLAPAGANGPIVVNVGADGAFSDILDGATPVGFQLVVDDGAFTAMIEDLLNGNLYYNVHTEDYQSGEIRGQIIVAEPIGIGLFGVGLLGLGLARRRRSSG